MNNLPVINLSYKEFIAKIYQTRIQLNIKFQTLQETTHLLISSANAEN